MDLFNTTTYFLYHVDVTRSHNFKDGQMRKNLQNLRNFRQISKNRYFLLPSTIKIIYMHAHILGKIFHKKGFKRKFNIINTINNINNDRKSINKVKYQYFL